MTRISLTIALVLSLLLTSYIHTLDPRHPLVVSVARTVRLVEIDAALFYTGLKAMVTGETDHTQRGALYLTKGWIKGPEVWEKARSAFYKGADAGNTEAAYSYAIMNLTGIGGPKNIPVAIDYFKKAAHQGHRNANWQLGNLYLSPAYYDVHEATRWFANAFQLGDKRAFALLVLINPSRTQAV